MHDRKGTRTYCVRESDPGHTNLTMTLACPLCLHKTEMGNNASGNIRVQTSKQLYMAGEEVRLGTRKDS
jgi:hypothetical protein